MADRDQDWGQRGGREQRERGERDQDRWRRDRERGSETRSFGDERRIDEDRDRYGPGTRGRRFEGGEPWRGEGRWGSRYDQDRMGYRDMGGDEARFGGYGGQEYGIEGGREHYGRPGERGGQGGGQDYAYHSAQENELDPEYLTWRDQQMKSHDRDYQEWRKHQQSQYDDDYRKFRTHRRDHFGRTFQAWRSQQSLVGGVPDTSVAPGVSGYGDKTGIPGGYNVSNAAKPSGMPEAPHEITADPAMRQTGGEDAGGGGTSGAGDTGSEFGKEPPQVQAAAGGWDGRGAPEDRNARLEQDARDRDDERRRREEKRDEKK